LKTSFGPAEVVSVSFLQEKSKAPTKPANKNENNLIFIGPVFI
jgi:hypothetical protein